MKPERLPHPATVNREVRRLLSVASQVSFAATELRKEYESAYEASLSQGASGEIATLGRGFTESDPTGKTATNATLSQLRWRVSKAAGCATRARTALEEGLSFIGDGFLRLDPDAYSQWLAKRIAAEDG